MGWHQVLVPKRAGEIEFIQGLVYCCWPIDRGKEDLCQKFGSLPVPLVVSAVCSQKPCLRQEIAWWRQPAIQSNLSSLRAGTLRPFVLFRSMSPTKRKRKLPLRRRLQASAAWTCS